MATSKGKWIIPGYHVSADLILGIEADPSADSILAALATVDVDHDGPVPVDVAIRHSRADHCTHPTWNWCNCDWCRYIGR